MHTEFEEVELEEVEKKHRGLNQKIREAEEDKGRGANVDEWLKDLKAARSNRTAEEQQLANREYMRRRGREEEQRSKFRKMMDAMESEL